ncbi:MAG: bifunctional demethylmenaquinone methyltransferase/2-methoxy-6-polyprenyl-1,4-benzoquinol methylase UbiE [Rikenellaceae bacterium]|jgi:demethylmenaquinone methyltransferase/2-methoxy-6-polyprenyl-1,4-benzoquinol methylase|nr:bifunctional demethylmenaquinone methyltransferase/2-methoxy-6-polyprenyl-1,4-benzoquinol methylase UbiE [Rikenellaceae bacterium]
MKPYDNNREKGEQVREMFDAIAPRYDLLNRLMSMGIDRLWRRRLARMARRGNPLRILDVATGTADMAILMARRCPEAQITGVDPSEGMLAVAAAKIARRGLEQRIALMSGSAEELDLPVEHFDATTVVFGVRNFSSIPDGLAAIARRLKRGGAIYILEFSVPKKRIFSYFYRRYFHRVVPALGGWLSGDRSAYRYLPCSVDEFPATERFLKLMFEAGFGECCAWRVFFGVANIYRGVR